MGFHESTHSVYIRFRKKTWQCNFIMIRREMYNLSNKRPTFGKDINLSILLFMNLKNEFVVNCNLHASHYTEVRGVTP